jgi:hypothetical protein
MAPATYALILLALLSPLTPIASAWSNGGCSSEPSVPDYGTHDWIAGHALDLLPANEKGFIENNLTIYLYATELPDCSSVPGGIGDRGRHHVYYYSNGALQDGAAAVRAQAFYQDAAVALVLRDFQQAARSAGVMSHYLSDLAVFGHVMDDSTDWGEEIHHSDYEDHVNTLTNNYDDEFNGFLKFDQRLDSRTAYNATLTLAYDTTFDTFESRRTASWMDDDRNYNWDNSDFRNRAGQSINLAVNLLADVLHTLSQQDPSGSADQPGSYSTLPYVILAVALVVIMVVVFHRNRKKK